MKCFVTGGTGFVGRHLVMWLTKQHPEFEIGCLVRSPEKSEWMTAYPNVCRVFGDLQAPATYQEHLLTADIVFHAAALVGLRDGQEFYAQNTDTTRTLLTLLKQSQRLRRLVYVSSISAVDRPLDVPASGPMDENTVPLPNTDYGKSKLMAERLIEDSGLPYTILRPSYIYGPFPRAGSSMDRLVRDMLSDKPYTHIPFPGRASFIAAKDLAEALWRASQSPNTLNRAYFVANREPIAIQDVFSALAKPLHRRWVPKEITPALFARFKRLAYHLYPTQPLIRVLFEDSFYCSSGRLCRDLAWEPPTPLSDGIAETLLDYQDLIAATVS